MDMVAVAVEEVLPPIQAKVKLTMEGQVAVAVAVLASLQVMVDHKVLVDIMEEVLQIIKVKLVKMALLMLVVIGQQILVLVQIMVVILVVALKRVMVVMEEI